MATKDPVPSSAEAPNTGPYTNRDLPVAGPRDLQGKLKGGKGPYGGVGLLPGGQPRPK
jgi:hypothetical protein